MTKEISSLSDGQSHFAAPLKVVQAASPDKTTAIETVTKITAWWKFDL